MSKGQMVDTWFGELEQFKLDPPPVGIPTVVNVGRRGEKAIG